MIRCGGCGLRPLGTLVVVIVGMTAAVLAGVPAAAAGPVPAGAVRIMRDEYGVPQEYAATAGALFFGDGYATAEDRLWQADLVRRTATGTLSELVGPGGGQNVGSDQFFRSYSGGQGRLDAVFAGMTASDRRAVTNYVAGINAWISTATQSGALPLEYGAVHQSPRLWTVTDVVASGMLAVLQVGAQGFDELHNALALQDMTTRLGPVEGSKAFTDTHWLDDPTALTTIPFGGRSRSAGVGADQPGPARMDPAWPSPDALGRVQQQRDAAAATMDGLGLGG